MARVLSKKDQIRQQAENDFESFIRLVQPQRVLGLCHLELITWWNREDRKSHQLVLMPRDHMKSALVALRAAWRITRNPAIRILYISNTANLAIKQLSFIKDILTSEIYRFYWPDMVNVDEGKRRKWTETEISVDHPLRAAEVIRDPTVFTAGLTTSIAGLHCDIAIMDDVVVIDNAYTGEGRAKCEQQYSLLASIEAGEAEEWIVGTRYHPKDLYGAIAERQVDQYDEEGNLTGTEPLYEVYERQVESRGDGAGEFLWPRQQRADGRWFGFDAAILAKKRGQYFDKVQFRAQYYNDPNDYESAGIKREDFQYYNRKYVRRVDSKWFYKDERLNLFAAIDFAYTLGKRSDYSAIAVVGVDSRQNFYVLEIDRFKTDNIAEYFKHILYLHQKWDFRKLRAEATAAQSVIIKDLKQNYVRVHGLSLSIEENSPTKHQGTKQERVNNILSNRYKNLQIWHYMDGDCQTLEDELVMANPPHDDCKDSLAAAIESAVAPSGTRTMSRPLSITTQPYNSRFGGIQ